MLKINYNENTISFEWENSTDGYPFDEIIINGVVTKPYRITNKERDGKRFFIVRDTNFHFILNNNSVYGTHFLLGSFSGEINNTMQFLPIEEDPHGLSCECE